MPDFKNMSAQELSAAIHGGIAEWGERASIEDHILYSKALPSKSRVRCHCGCKRRASHGMYANGIILGSGCEIKCARWIHAVNKNKGSNQ